MESPEKVICDPTTRLGAELGKRELWLKAVYPQSDGRIAMAFDESISMHQKSLSLCGNTSLLQ